MTAATKRVGVLVPANPIFRHYRHVTEKQDPAESDAANARGSTGAHASTQDNVFEDDSSQGGTTDNELLNELHLDDPERDVVDRSIVVSTHLKKLAMWALRLFAIAAGGYVLWRLVQQFWIGILPMLLALIVCTVLAPPTTWMRRKGVPDALAALTSILLSFGALSFIISIIAPDLVRQSQVLYLQAVEGIQRLLLWAQGPPLELNTEDVQQVVDDGVGWVQDQAGDIAGGVVSGLSTATSIVIQLFMVLVLVVFFLKDGHRFLPWLRSVLGRRAGWHATEVLSRSWITLGGYVRAQAIVSAVDAFFIGVGLWIIGVPMAFTLAIITFVAGFIPYVGAVSAGALSILVALVSLGFKEAIIVVVLVIAVQQLEGNILSPLLQSKAMNLHPVVVLVSVVIGGGLLGILGAFLAVPVAAVIAVVFRYLIDMVALQAGEKKAADIEFATREGEAIGLLSEDQGRALRRRWRESEQALATDSLAQAPDFLESDETTAPERDLVRSARQLVEHTVGKIRRG